MDCATMHSFDFRHVTELHGLPNNGCQVPRSGQMRVASQQTDGPQTKLGYDTRYTWTLFLTHKNDAFHAFMRLAKVIQNKKSLKIISIRSDYGGEFENKDFEMFCDEHGI